jgi:antitoxin YefM
MNIMNVKFHIFVPCWYTKNFKYMLVISSREFRQNQRVYFERADKGEQIIVQRGKDKAYALTPINEDDIYFNAKMLEKFKQSVKEAQEGKVTRITTSKEISDLLGL